MSNNDLVTTRHMQWTTPSAHHRREPAAPHNMTACTLGRQDTCMIIYHESQNSTRRTLAFGTSLVAVSLCFVLKYRFQRYFVTGDPDSNVHSTSKQGDFAGAAPAPATMTEGVAYSRCFPSVHIFHSFKTSTLLYSKWGEATEEMQEQDDSRAAFSRNRIFESAHPGTRLSCNGMLFTHRHPT